MSNIEFESPAARVVKQFSEDGKEQFKIPVNLPDLTFLRALSVQGRLVFVQGEVTGTAAATIVEFIPPNGTTFFFYAAFCQSRMTSGNVPEFEIQNDGNTREVIPLGLSLGNSGFWRATMKMDSLVGNGIKSFRIRQTQTITSAEMGASMFGWTENTSRIRDVTI